MARWVAVARAILHGIERAIVTMLTRFAEQLTVYNHWARPVTKARGEVSGDHLAQYIQDVGDMPLPNIWHSKGTHGDN